MGRLERRQNKILRRRLYILGGIFVVVLLFMSNIGLSFLADASLYVNRLFSGGKTEKVDDFLGSLQLDEVDPATSSAQIIISGFANDYDTLKFYINDEKVKEVDIDDEQNFQEEIGDLDPGSNEIYVSALSKSRKKEKQSPIITVSYINTKPTIEISEPADNAKTNKNEIKVVGKAGTDVTVKVNGIPAVVDTSGGFQTVVKLNEGDNKIKVDVVDRAGNANEKEITVKYEKD